MGKHVADQPRERLKGTRIREYTRIQREQGAGGPHPSTRRLQRRAFEASSGLQRMREFIRRELSGRH